MQAAARAAWGQRNKQLADGWPAPLGPAPSGEKRTASWNRARASIRASGIGALPLSPAPPPAAPPTPAPARDGSIASPRVAVVPLPLHEGSSSTARASRCGGAEVSKRRKSAQRAVMMAAPARLALSCAGGVVSRAEGPAAPHRLISPARRSAGKRRKGKRRGREAPAAAPRPGPPPRALSRPRRSRSASNASTLPRPRMSAARWVVLFPGAAHASTTVQPGCGDRTVAGMHDARPCAPEGGGRDGGAVSAPRATTAPRTFRTHPPLLFRGAEHRPSVSAAPPDARLEDEFPGVQPGVSVEARPRREEEDVRHERIARDLRAACGPRAETTASLDTTQAHSGGAGVGRPLNGAWEGGRRGWPAPGRASRSASIASSTVALSVLTRTLRGREAAASAAATTCAGSRSATDLALACVKMRGTTA